MKRIIKFYIESLIRFFFKISFLLQVRFNRNVEIWVVDIDNTLADTWKSFLHPYVSDYQRLTDLSPLLGMIEKVKLKKPVANIIFLSARNYRYFFVTRKWLKNKGLPLTLTNVILVDKAIEKVAFLKQLHKKNKVTYFDDLTYGHERGEMQYHDEVINAVKLLEIKYIDVNKINEINIVC